VLARFDLRPSDFADAFRPFPLATFIGMFEAAAEVTGDRLLGVRLAQAMTPETLLGPLGTLFTNCPNVQVAFEKIGQFLSLWQSHSVTKVEIGAARSAVAYKIEDDQVWPRRQDAEFTMMCICQFISGLIGRSWRPLEVHFEHEAPRQPDRIAAAFGVPVQFGQETNRIVFPTALLSRRLMPVSAELAPLIEKHLHEMAGSESDSMGRLTSRIRFILVTRLGKGEVSVDSVAEELGMSSRTLQRRLGEEGVSFRDMLREQRLRLAEGLIADRSMPVTEIAGMLGYTESTALSRAFKHWTGHSPRDFARHAAQQA
jgi:AraC-like DNA-binding protein